MTTPTDATVSVVVPLFNEEAVVPALVKRLAGLRQALPLRFQFVLVNDGSTDTTGRLLDEIASQMAGVQAVHLSRNFGHQQAVSAGLSLATGDYVAVMDGDLQDPPEEIVRFIAKLQEGFDVVYAVRRNRKENWLKKFAYLLFYKILARLSTIDIPLDTGDFCVMRKTVVDQITRMPERHRFVRGLRCYAGYRQTGMEYSRDHRAAGRPKYTFWKLLELAADGIFTFSTKPLRLATMLGFCSVVLALVYSTYIVIWRIFAGEQLPGFASIIVVVLYLGSVQLFCIGILGEYIGRIHNEVKGRPGFIISRITQS
jgi:glycosyltransferase involved in cell wall biosynthesis